MAEYRSTDVYGPGGGDYVDDAGRVWPDPWGVLPADQQPQATGAPPEGLQSVITPPSQFGPPTAPPPAAPGTPNAAQLAQFNQPSIGEGRQPTAAETRPSAPLPPQLTPGMADQRPQTGAPTSAAGAAPPQLTPGMADRVTTTSGTTKTQGTEGLSDEAIQRQQGFIEQVSGAKSKVVDATVNQQKFEADQAAARSQALLVSAAQGAQEVAAKQAVNEYIQQDTDRRMKAASDWQPDRGALFHGAQGVGFAIAAAIAGMAGAYMQVRGFSGTNPYLPTIMKLIDDNVNDQVRSNSQTIQFLREQKGDLKAAAIELKQRQLGYAQQRLDSLAMRDKSDLIRVGVEKTRAEMQAQNGQWEQEKRQALEKKVTSSVAQHFQRSVAPPAAAGAGANGGERNEKQAAAQAAQDTMNQVAQKAGLVRDPHSGKWVVGDATSDVIPPGAWESVNPFSNDSIAAAGDAFTQAYGSMISGAQIGKEEQKRFELQTGRNTYRPSALAERLNAVEPEIRARLRSNDANDQGARARVPEAYR